MWLATAGLCLGFLVSGTECVCMSVFALWVCLVPLVQWNHGRHVRPNNICEACRCRSSRRTPSRAQPTGMEHMGQTERTRVVRTDHDARLIALGKLSMGGMAPSVDIRWGALTPHTGIGKHGGS